MIKVEDPYFKKTHEYLDDKEKLLDQLTKEQQKIYKIAEKGLYELQQNTPKKTGYTASCWDYTIEQNGRHVNIIYTNSNMINDWFNVALFLELGHNTVNGGWVEGTEYINDSIKDAFTELILKASEVID